MSLLSDIRARLDPIPLVLRIAAVASIGIGIAFPLVAVIPGATFDLAGAELSWRELWQTRVALALLASGPLMLVVGLGILWRARWVRPVLVVLPVLQFLPFQLVHWLFSAPDPTPSLQPYLFSIASWAFLAGGYLFGFHSARAYFSPQRRGPPPNKALQLTGYRSLQSTSGIFWHRTSGTPSHPRRRAGS